MSPDFSIGILFGAGVVALIWFVCRDAQRQVVIHNHNVQQNEPPAEPEWLDDDLDDDTLRADYWKDGRPPPDFDPTLN